MSSWTLILFDIDGMTAVVPRKDLQPCPKEVIVKSGKAYFKHGNDNLLVEVLELSGELTHPSPLKICTVMWYVE